MFEDVRYSSCGRLISREPWIHPNRTIDSHEVLFVISGPIFLSENGTDYTLGQNDVFILEPGLHHLGTKPSEAADFFWLHLHGIPTQVPLFKQKQVSDPYGLTLLFRQILQYRVEQKPAEAMDYLARLILMELLSGSLNPASSRSAEIAAAWIRANRSLPLRVSQVAAHLGYHPDYLNRLFKSVFQKSVKEYIDAERMNCIKSLLLTSQSTLSETASAAGFSDYKCFLKFFKYHEGMTPTEFCKIYAREYVNTK